MTLYNVLVPVVALVEGEDADEAINKLAGELRDHGFDPYLESSQTPSAFVSEPQE